MLTQRFKQANRPPEGTSWCWLTAEMLESPAWRALTGNAMKVVLRIVLEHLKHGGVENGVLPVTYQDFVRYGVRRNAIRESKVIAIHLGWIDETSTGEVPWHGDIRRPSTFALTWLPYRNGALATNRWARIKSDLDAKAAIKRAKAELVQVRRLAPSFNRQKKQIPTPESVTSPGVDVGTCSGSDSISGESESLQASSNDGGTPFYISASRALSRSSDSTNHDRTGAAQTSDACESEQPNATTSQTGAEATSDTSEGR